MALDGAFLYAVRQELSGLIGSRIEKIHQPAREEILISLRNMEGSHKILISASADRARVHLTQQSIDTPPAPPMFCMLLRKRLGNGKLLAIRQDGLERVLYFDFSCVNTLGDVVQLTLACEIMGKYSNLILMDETGKVVDSIKRVDVPKAVGFAGCCLCIATSRTTVEFPDRFHGNHSGCDYCTDRSTSKSFVENAGGRFSGVGTGMGIFCRKRGRMPSRNLDSRTVEAVTGNHAAD